MTWYLCCSVFSASQWSSITLPSFISYLDVHTIPLYLLPWTLFSPSPHLTVHYLALSYLICFPNGLHCIPFYHLFKAIMKFKSNYLLFRFISFHLTFPPFYSIPFLSTSYLTSPSFNLLYFTSHSFSSSFHSYSDRREEESSHKPYKRITGNQPSDTPHTTE